MRDSSDDIIKSEIVKLGNSIENLLYEILGELKNFGTQIVENKSVSAFNELRAEKAEAERDEWKKQAEINLALAQEAADAGDEAASERDEARDENEEHERLKVATARLMKMLPPRVTAVDFETLSDVAERIAKSKAEGDALRAELRLDDLSEALKKAEAEVSRLKGHPCRDGGGFGCLVETPMDPPCGACELYRENIRLQKMLQTWLDFCECAPEEINPFEMTRDLLHLKNPAVGDTTNREDEI